LKELKTLRKNAGRHQGTPTGKSKKAFQTTDDPKRPLVSAVESCSSALDFAPMENCRDVLQSQRSADLSQALAQANANGGAALASASLTEVNKCLSKASAS